MPWCGYWGMNGYWWILPLLGLVFIAVMIFACSRGFGCMPLGRRRSGELADLQRDVQGLKDDVRKLLGQPN